MNRREALKNISISFGSITLSAGVLSMLQSCQSNNSDWSPEFFSNNQLSFVDRMFELIIPETDTPGAISLNLSSFVDSYINRNIPSKNQSELSAEINEFLNIILKNESKNNISEVDDISLETYLSNHIDNKSFKESNGENYSQICELLREMAVRSYKLSEYVLINKLRYVPVPGYYDGNVDI